MTNAIVVCQARWEVLSPTLNLLQGLAAAKKNPIFCHYDCRTLTGNRPLACLGVAQWPLLSWRRWFFKVGGRLARQMRWHLPRLMFWPLRLAAIKIVQRLKQSGVQPLCLIGIEKQGLILAALVAAELQVPFVYYSLELYGDDHPFFAGNREFKEWRRLEKYYHRLAAATIIQDELRAQALFRSNDCPFQPVFFLPVSLLGPAHHDRNHSLQRRLKLPLNSRILLAFGNVDQALRCSLDLAAMAGQLPTGYNFVFHGSRKKEDIAELKARNFKQVYLSTEVIAESRLPEMMASAFAGLAIYRPNNENNILTAFASEKVAYYLCSGVPIIAFDNENYRSLLQRFDCGVLVKRIDEIPAAVELLAADYENKRKQAFLAYNALYHLQPRLGPLIEFLEKLESNA